MALQHSKTMHSLLTVGLIFGLTACGEQTTDANTNNNIPNTSTEAESGTTEPFEEPELDLTDLGGERPSKVFVPTQYTAAESWPLVVLLHGYTASGFIQNQYMGLSGRVDSRGYILLTPDGLVDRDGSRFWNATTFCCDFYRTGVDDVSYIMSLIEEAKERYNINDNKVYLVGHSNGGFLANRIACEHADTIAGIMSLAGTSFVNASECENTGGVSILHVHGTEDETIFYNGTASYPSAEELMVRWRDRNGCEGTSEAPSLLDIDQAVAGEDTTVVKSTGCRDSKEAELWTINGGGHVPYLASDFMDRVFDFLFKQSL